ncbi:MAG: hypothetical protein RI580_06165 [Halothece sp. Uz-M2-17]|nr:hypothetical protein [Halothece sp. Uz-M2-17]
MTLEELFAAIVAWRVPLLLLMLSAPWATYWVCYAIPGKREEPLVLSINLSLSTLSFLLWLGYLFYTVHSSGWQRVIIQADLLLLLLPPYYFAISLWVSRRRLPLEQVPAARFVKGLAFLSGGLFATFWLLDRIHIIFFSYLPLPIFFGVLLICLTLAYLGYRYLFQGKI